MPPLETGGGLAGESFHYPPDVHELLVETMPRLVRAKQALLDFFHGCGVPTAVTADMAETLAAKPDSITKFRIARTILTRLNEQGDLMLAQRREVIRRVVEFDAFSQCWPNEQAQARGLVAQLREIVGQKDAFTRMQQDRDREVSEKRRAMRAAYEERRMLREAMAAVRDRLAGLFGEPEPHRRGTLFQGVLNDLFRENDIGVREAFVRVGNSGEGVVEQVDGAIEVDGHLFLVEAKWWEGPIGPVEVRDLLSKVYSRADARGLFISATPYTAAAVGACREALGQRVVVLSTLEEIIKVLEAEDDFTAFLRQKVRAAQLDMNPFATVSLSPKQS